MSGQTLAGPCPWRVQRKMATHLTSEHPWFAMRMHSNTVRFKFVKSDGCDIHVVYRDKGKLEEITIADWAMVDHLPDAKGWFDTAPNVDLVAKSREMCEANDWDTGWSARGCYLHLEASELIEAWRGKQGDTLSEAADVYIVLLSILAANGMTLTDLQVTANQIMDREIAKGLKKKAAA